jgi:hypothetical protein
MPISVNDFNRDGAIFDSGSARAENKSDIPLAGTATAGAVVQGRAYSLDDSGATSTDWADIATADGAGDWTGSLVAIPKNVSYYRAEVRLKLDTGTTAATTNKFAVGHIVSIWGQSEQHRIVKAFFDQAPDAVSVLDDDTLQISFDERNSQTVDPPNPEFHVVTAANPVTNSIAALANMLYSQTGGEKFLLICNLKSGTSWNDLVNDSLTSRLWATDLAIHNAAITEVGQKVGLATSSWYAAPAAYGTRYMQWFVRTFFGKDDAGADITVPSSITIGGDTITFDHVGSDIYDYDYTRWMLFDPHTFVPTEQLTNATTNAAGGSNTTLANKQIVRETVRSFLKTPIGALTLNQVETLRWDKTSRGVRIPMDKLKVPGVDALPTGYTYTALTGRIRVAPGVVAANGLYGWNLTGCYLVVEGHVPFVRDCYVEQNKTTGIPFYLIDLYVTGSIGDVSWNTFDSGGAKSRGSMSCTINQRSSGTGASTIAGRCDLITRNAFYGCPTDSIKSSCTGEISWNFFDTPVNLEYLPDLWDSGTTFALGDLTKTTSGGQTYYFKSLSDGNINNSPPTSKTSTAFWGNLDPHVDTINPRAITGNGALLVRANYISQHNGDREMPTAGHGMGFNNGLRIAANTGSGLLMKPSVFEYNVISRDSGLLSYPVQIVSDDPQTLRNNWITPSNGGQMWYPGDELDNVITGNVGYNSTLSDPRGFAFDSVFTRLGAAMLTYSMGQDDGAGGWEDQAHPTPNTNDGLVRSAELIASNILLGLRLADWDVPSFDQCEWQQDGSYVEVWSTTGPITTTAIANSDAPIDLGPNPSHWQEVNGWQVNGLPATNVQLVSGKVRIYKNQAEDAFSATDSIAYGLGAASGQLSADEDNIYQQWRNLPIVDVGAPLLEGIPVFPLPSASILANTMPSNPYFIASSTGPYFKDTSTLGSGVSTLVYYAKVKPTTPISTAGFIFYLSASQIGVRRLANTTGLNVTNIKDSANVSVLSGVSTGTLPLDVYAEVLVDIDLISQTADLYIDGVLSTSFALSANTGMFASTRNLGFLASDAGAFNFEGEVESLKVWKNASVVGGAQPGGTPYKTIEGYAATVNADPWKLGTNATGPSVDTTAPILSSLAVVAGTSSQLEFQFSTDEVGTAYWYVSTSATPPSAAALVAGTGAVFFASVVVASTGLQSAITVTGLAADTTYYVYVLEDDAAGNRSSISSASGATAPSGDSIAPTLDTASVSVNGLTVTAVADEAIDAGTDGWSGITVGGVALNYTSGARTTTVVFTAASRIPAGTVTLNYTQPGDGIQDLSGNLLDNISGASVTNNSAPVVTGVAVNSTGDLVTFTFDVSVTGHAGLTITDASPPITLTYSAGDPGTSVAFVPNRDVLQGETMTFAYAAGDIVATTGGSPVASVTGGTVTNGSAVTPTGSTIFLVERAIDYIRIGDECRIPFVTKDTGGFGVVPDVAPSSANIRIFRNGVADGTGSVAVMEISDIVGGFALVYTRVTESVGDHYRIIVPYTADSQAYEAMFEVRITVADQFALSSGGSYEDGSWGQKIAALETAVTELQADVDNIYDSAARLELGVVRNTELAQDATEAIAFVDLKVKPEAIRGSVGLTAANLTTVLDTITGSAATAATKSTEAALDASKIPRPAAAVAAGAAVTETWTVVTDTTGTLVITRVVS